MLLSYDKIKNIDKFRVFRCNKEGEAVIRPSLRDTVHAINEVSFVHYSVIFSEPKDYVAYLTVTFTFVSPRPVVSSSAVAIPVSADTVIVRIGSTAPLTSVSYAAS